MIGALELSKSNLETSSNVKKNVSSIGGCPPSDRKLTTSTEPFQKKASMQIRKFSPGGIETFKDSSGKECVCLLSDLY